MKTIAVATDLSTRSDHAVSRAFRLAAERDATLRVFSVVDDTLPPEMVETLIEGTTVRLRRLCSEQPLADKVAWTTHVLRGSPDEAISTATEAQDVELMVLGLHRTRPLMDLIRETTMERLVRQSPRPVLIVRNPPEGSYTCVLGAIDFAPASARALRMARTIAPDATLHGFHAVQIPYQSYVAAPGVMGDIPPIVSVEPFLKAARIERDTFLATNADLKAMDVTIDQGSIHAALRDKMQELSPDLLTLGTHGRALPVPWLLGSFANDMMRDPPTDLLIVPPQR